MKKIIVIFVLSMLSLSIYANTEENTLLLFPVEAETKEKIEEEKFIITLREESKKTNKYIRLKGYFDLPGELVGESFVKGGTSKLANIDAGLEGMVEGVYRFSESGEIAMGLGIQRIGNINSAGLVSGNNYALPVYLSGKYNIKKSPIYIKGLIGITFNYGSDDLKSFIAKQEDPSLGLTKDSIDLEHGLYGALGLGIDIGKFEIEGLYSVNTISSSYTNPTDDKVYTRELENYRISIGASYAFDWKK